MELRISVFADMKTDKPLFCRVVQLSEGVYFPYEIVVTSMRALFPSFKNLVVDFKLVQL